MYQPPPQSDLAAYRYNPQAIEDHDDDHVREKKTRTDGRANRANYRPTPLTWPFIVVLMLLFAAAIGLVVYIRQSKQGTDTTANITGRQLVHFPHFPRQVGLNTTVTNNPETSAVPTVVSSSSKPVETTQISSAGLATSIPAEQTKTGSAAAKETTPSDPVTTTTPSQLPSKSALPSSAEDISEATSPQISVESVTPTKELLPQTTTKLATSSLPTQTAEDSRQSGASSPTATSTGGNTNTNESPSQESTITRTGGTSSGSQQGAQSETLRSGSETSAPTGTSSPNKGTSRTPTTTPSDTSITRAITTPSGVLTGPTTMTTTVCDEHACYEDVIIKSPYTSTPTSHKGSQTTFTTRSFTSTSVLTTTKPGSTLTSTVGSSTSTGTLITTVPTTEVVTVTPSATKTSRPYYSYSYSTIATSSGSQSFTFTLTSTLPPPPPPPSSASVITITTETVITTPITSVIGGSETIITLPASELPITTEIVTQSFGISYIDIGVSTITSRRTLSGIVPTEKTIAIPVTSVVVDGPSTVTYVQTGAPKEVVTKEDDQLITQVSTWEAQTYVSTIAGVPATIVGVTTLAGTGEPVTYEVVSTIGGYLTTYVQSQEAQTFVSTVDGVVQTFVSTPPPQTFTSMIDGTLTTMTMVSTPTGSIVSSYTLTTNFGQSLTTIVSTPSPSTFVSTSSGKLITFTSTPSPTTKISTLSASSHTTISTSTTTAGPSTPVEVTITSYSLTKAEYFAGKFLPALLAVMLAIPLRIIDMNAKLYQPFHAMAQPAGAYGGDSMTLQYSGLKGFITPVITLVQGYPVPFISTFAVLASSFIVPLATEAIGVKLHGDCKIGNVSGCAPALGASPNLCIILVVLLGFIIILLALLLFFLRKYETGLYSNPWSIAGMSSIATNPDIRLRSASDTDLKRELAEKRFGLGIFENSRGQDDYGVVLVDESGRQLTDGDDNHPSLNGIDDGGGETNPATGNKRHSMPFMVLTFTWRILFMFVLLGMFGLVLYYHLTHSKDTPLTRWILRQDFGVRFVFAGIGVAIAFGWTAFFLSVAIVSPFYTMHARAQPPDKSILLTRPTNSVFGLYTAVKRADWFLIVISFLTILNEFLPILLANVPYTLTQTEDTHVICSRFSMAILMANTITLFGSLFINWPHLPADPRNVAGAMYYVLESRMLADFEGTSRMERKERDKWVMEKGRRYFYGEMIGPGGSGRMAVEGDAVSGARIERLGTVKTEYRGYDGT